MLEKALAHLPALIMLGYGAFYAIWPERGRRMYMAHFDPDAPLKWYNPKTWLRSKPPTYLFRIVGVVFIVLGLLLFYITTSKYAV
jgi:hypothetical protein